MSPFRCPRCHVEDHLVPENHLVPIAETTVRCEACGYNLTHIELVALENRVVSSRRV